MTVPPYQPFTVFPAIDLRGGQVVRLKMGDPGQQTAFSDDPAGVARRWLEAGASWLHVVNLDGALGEADDLNRRALEGVLAAAKAFGACVQYGGGVRSVEAIEALLGMGVNRVILGSAVVEQPDLVARAIARWDAERIAASLDAWDGFVRVRGWRGATALQAVDLARRLAAGGLRWLVYTDIRRDGLETGANLEQTAALLKEGRDDGAQVSGLRVIASGGTSSLEEVQRARVAGLAGIIVGKALYSGAIEAEELFRKEEEGS